MRNETEEKYKKLRDEIKSFKSMAVAYSGGTDSTLLLKIGHEILGKKCIAVTASAPIYISDELKEAEDFCKSEKIEQKIISYDPFKVEGFKMNPENRCYICKKAVFSRLKEYAEANNYKFCCDGTNADDLGDYRPGLLAKKELGIVSPLLDTGMGKSEIREISRFLGLKTAEKPSSACLASRFAYGDEITIEKLKMVDEAEKYLKDSGFNQLRVRIHGLLARIEVEEDQMEKLFSMRNQVSSEFLKMGFKYITLDLKGYRMGSMNEMIRENEDGKKGSGENS